MMSGGVDSSVAAALLREQGHDVTGVTLKLWGGESDSGCCSVSDVEDARRVAAQLGIPHYVFNFSDALRRPRRRSRTSTRTPAGETPNPCVECNRTMKFGRVLERAEQLGLRLGRDRSPRAHRRRRRKGPRSRAALDPAKDQSYVLYMLGAQQLARTLLPVGELTKADVRERARTLGLRTADKRESMDVCFITENGREAFLGARIPRRPGHDRRPEGAVVGEHDGDRRVHDRPAAQGRRRRRGAAVRRRHRDLRRRVSRSGRAMNCCAIGCD